MKYKINRHYTDEEELMLVLKQPPVEEIKREQQSLYNELRVVSNRYESYLRPYEEIIGLVIQQLYDKYAYIDPRADLYYELEIKNI